MLSYKSKQILKKGLKKVISFKFELVITFIYMLFNIYCIVYHICLNGFNQFNFGLELIIYTMITILCYISMLCIRKEILLDLYKRLK